MKILRKDQEHKDYVFLSSKDLLIKSDGTIQKKKEEIPIQDIALFLCSDLKEVKSIYEDIKDSYDYQIVELMLNTQMYHLNYFDRYELKSFEDIFYYTIYLNPEKINIWNNSDYIDIRLAALILCISEQKMLDLARVETEVYEGDNREYYILMKDFVDYYRQILEEIGVNMSGRIDISQSNDFISVLIERKLNE